MPIYSDLSINPTTKTLATDVEAIKQSLALILSTKKGERLFRPQYGIDLDESIFELVSDDVALEIERKVFAAIEAFEPRVVIDKQKSYVKANVEKQNFDLLLVLRIKGVVENESIIFSGVLNN